jgi:Domain of unknown function (DUF4157)
MMSLPPSRQQSAPRSTAQEHVPAMGTPTAFSSPISATHSLPLQRRLGNRALARTIQHKKDTQLMPIADTHAVIHQAAASGIRTPSTDLPHHDLIQQSFGNHDLSHVQAHVGSAATASATAMNAAAFASGSHIVFAGQPDLHTAAHEAAHVVQQQAGIHLAGGIGQVGDVYERHADAVAQRVVAGQSAEQLLNQFSVEEPLSQTPSIGLQRLTGPIQCDTLIDGAPGTYDYDSDTYSETAGARAWAYLDPNDAKNGSGPSDSALHGSMEDLSNLGYQSMIKGHLINGQVGGPGLAGNLFPITSQANSKHKWYAENLIKQEVTKRKGSGWGVYYSVEVTEAARSSSSPDACFTCEAYDWNIAKGHKTSAVNSASPILKPVDIESHPAVGSTGTGKVTPLLIGTDAFGNKFKYKTNTPASVNFPNAKLGKGWGEQGSGKGSGGRDWSHLSDDMDT